MNNKKFVLDTNLFISSLLRKNTPPSILLEHIIFSGTLVFSKETFKELVEVISRKKFEKYISPEKRTKFITQLIDEAQFITPQKKFDICRDAKDNVFLDVAVEAQVDFLISGDDDLLVLKEVEGIPMLTAREALNLFLNN